MMIPASSTVWPVSVSWSPFPDCDWAEAFYFFCPSMMKEYSVGSGQRPST